MAKELLTAIRAITGSVVSGTPATTDDQLIIFLNNASNFVISNLPIEYAIPFWKDSSAITSNAGFTVISDRIVQVRRNGRACKQIGLGLAYAQDLTPTFTITVSDYANIAVGKAITIDGIKLYCQESATTEKSDFIKETSNQITAQNIVDAITNTFSAPIVASLNDATISITGANSVTSEDAIRLIVTQSATSTSLYKATELFPAYYVMANKVYIKPDPTASAVGYVTYVSPLTFTNGDSSEMTVSGVKTIILDYAIHQDYAHLAGVWRDLAQTELAKVTTATTGYLALFNAALPTWSDVTAPTMPTLTIEPMTTLPTLTLSNASDSWPTFSETITLPELVLPVMTALPVLQRTIASNVFVTGEANTSDATAETILTVEMEDDTTLQMQLWITGITDDGANSGSYALFIAYKKDGTNDPVQIGDYETGAHIEVTDEEWNGVTFEVSSSNILVKVSGKADTNISWNALALKTTGGSSIALEDVKITNPIVASLNDATISITGANSVTSEDAIRLIVTQSATSTSLYKATELFPAYYVMANKVYIKPDPTASAVGYVTYVSPLTFTNGDSSEMTVSGVKTIILDYAIHQDYAHLAGVWRDLAQTELAKVTTATTGYLALFNAALPTWSDVTAPTMPTLTIEPMTTLPTLTLSNASDSWPTFSETITLPELVLPVMTALPVLQRTIASNVFVTGEANTSDATAETILTVEMEDDTTLQMQLWITGITDDGANSGSYALFIAYKKDGTNDPVQIGDYETGAHIEVTDEEWNGVTFEVSSSNILVKVSGKADTNISWNALALKTTGGSSIALEDVKITNPGTLSMPIAPSLPVLTLSEMDSLPTALTEANMNFSGITEPSYSAPTAPDSITLPTLTVPALDTLPDALEYSNIDLSGIKVPVYTQPDAPAPIELPTLVVPELDPLPTALSEADIDFSGITSPTYTQPTIGTAIGTLSITNKTVTDPGTLTMPSGINLPVLALTSAPTFTDLDLSVINVPGNTISYTSAGDAPSATITMTKSLPTFNMPVNEVDMSNFNTYMGTSIDDIEKAQLDIQKQSALINKFQVDANAELQRFNDDISSYRAELEKKVQEIQSGINAYNAKVNDSRNDLDEQVQQYIGDLNKYQQEVNAAVQEWIAEEVQFKLTKWQAQVQSEISEYNGKVQAEIQRYSQMATGAIGEYNANVQRQTQVFRAEMEADVNEWNIQKQADISKFQADISEAIGSYQAQIQQYANDVQKLVNKYTAESNSDLQIYRANYEKLIQKYVNTANTNIQAYQVEVNAIISKYNAGLQLYQIQVQESLQSYSNQIQEYIADVQKLVNVYTAEGNSDLQIYRANWEKLIQKFAQETNSAISEYQSVSNTLINDYVARINKYQADITEAIQSYNAEIQHYSTNVRKIIDQYVAESQSDIGIYQANYQKILGKFTAENNAKIAEYQSVSSALIAKYQAEISGYIQEFNANVNYRIQEAQFKLNREIQEYQAQVTAFINEYQTKATAEIGNYSAIVTARINEYNALLATYAQKVQAYISELTALRNSEISEYSSKVSAYLNEYQAKNNVNISNYNAESQSVLGEYSALVNNESQKFSAELNKAISYLQQITAVVNIANIYLAKSQTSFNNSIKYKEYAIDGLKLYITKLQNQEILE